jgi:hypothetical protein
VAMTNSTDDDAASEGVRDNEVAKVTEKLGDNSDKRSFQDSSEDAEEDDNMEDDSKDEVSKAMIRAMQKKLHDEKNKRKNKCRNNNGVLSNRKVMRAGTESRALPPVDHVRVSKGTTSTVSSTTNNVVQLN